MMKNQLPKVIAICGSKRAGKDTIAQYISAKYGYVHLKISQPLKEIMKVLFGFNEEQLETDIKDHVDEKWGISPRQAMQFFGTEIMQYKLQDILPDIGRSFWIKNAIARIESTPQNVVISDLRFLHEYEELRKKYMIYIIRIDKPYHNMLDLHLSEQEYKNIPHHVQIINDAGLQQLYITIDRIINQIV